MTVLDADLANFVEEHVGEDDGHTDLERVDDFEEAAVMVAVFVLLREPVEEDAMLALGVTVAVWLAYPAM